MTALKWRRLADSDGTTIMYTAVAGQPAPRQPFYSYRIFPLAHISGKGVWFYSITLWQGERELANIGSIVDTAWGNYRRGEYKLADAKRAAQDHYTATLTNV